MLFFVFLIIITVLVELLYSSNLITKRAACIIVAFYAIIIYSIRSENVGNVDVTRYVSSFKNIVNIKTNQIADYYSKDHGFYFFTKLVSYLFPNYNFWFFTIGTFFIINFSRLIYKFSTDILISYIIFFTFIFTINFSLLRHCCALSFVVWAYILIKEGNWKKALFVLIIATTFHLSSIIAFLMFPLKKIKFRLWNFLIIGASLAISILVPSLLFDIASVIRMERLNFYVGKNVMKLTMTPFYINFIFFIVMLLLINFKSKYLILKYNFELNMLSIGVSLYALVGILAEFYRTAMFFSFVIIILIPNVISEFQDKRNKYITKLGEYIFGLLLLIYFFTIVLYDHLIIPFEISRFF